MTHRPPTDIVEARTPGNPEERKRALSGTQEIKKQEVDTVTQAEDEAGDINSQADHPQAQEKHKSATNSIPMTRKKPMQSVQALGLVSKWTPPRTRQKSIRTVAIEDIMEVLYNSPEPLDFAAFSAVFKNRGITKKILEGRWSVYKRTFNSKKMQCSNYAVTEFVSKQLDPSEANGRPRRQIKQVKRLSPIFKRKGMVPLGSGKDPWVKTNEPNTLFSMFAAKQNQQHAIRRPRGRPNGSYGRPPLPSHTWPKKKGIKRPLSEEKSHSGRNNMEGKNQARNRPGNKRAAKSQKINGNMRPQREKKEVKRLSPVFRRKGLVPIHNPDLKAHRQTYNDTEKSSPPKKPRGRPPNTPNRKKNSCKGIQPKFGVQGTSRAPRRLPGVTWSTHRGKWEAETSHQGIKMHIGYFLTERAAWESITLYRQRMGWPPRKIGYSKRTSRREIAKTEVKTEEHSSSASSRPSMQRSRGRRKPSGIGELILREIDRGLIIDARDQDGKWCTGEVLEVKGRKKGRDRVLFLVRFKVPSNSREDSWLNLSDIARHKSRGTGKTPSVSTPPPQKKPEESKTRAQTQKRPRPDYSALSRGEKVERSIPVAAKLTEENSSDRNTNGRSNPSDFIGIWPQRKRWRACISHNGQRMHLGSYSTPELAARAWDAKARELRGILTKTNFPLSRAELNMLSNGAKSHAEATATNGKKKPGRKRGRPRLDEKICEVKEEPQMSKMKAILNRPKPSIPWVDDLTPRSSRRAKPKNYRAMEKGNFNEVFALQLKAFRLRAKQQQEQQQAKEAEVMATEEGKLVILNGHRIKAGEPPKQRNGGIVTPVAKFPRGEILAVFAGSMSIDGESFWLFECTQQCDGSSQVTGFYYRKEKDGRYERDPGAPRQRISVDSVMRDLTGKYVTYKRQGRTEKKWINLTCEETKKLHGLADAILKMQGIAETSDGQAASVHDDILSDADPKPSAESTAEAQPANHDVLGLGELPMQLRNLLGDPIAAANPTTETAAVSTSASAVDTSVMLSVEIEDNPLLVASNSESAVVSGTAAAASSDGVATSLADIAYKPMGGDQPMQIFDTDATAAAGDKVASMFLE